LTNTNETKHWKDTTQLKGIKIENAEEINYSGLVASYDTRPENEADLFCTSRAQSEL